LNALPSKQELLTFQARWMRTAGAAALTAAVISVVALGVQRVGLHFPSGNSDADQLAFVHAHAGRQIGSAVLQGISVALFAIPLLFLFKAAAGRTERMRPAFAVLIIVGPVALALGLIGVTVGGTQAADDFVKRAPAAEQQARQQAESAASTPAKPGGKPAPTTTGANAAAAAKPRTPDQAASDARENVADDVNKHTTLLAIGSLIQLVGVVAILFAFIYTPLWAMRTGLLTRGMGILGIAAGLFLVFPVIPQVSGLLALVWFAVLGLSFLGIRTRPLPPAWAAGEAIPWPSREDIEPQREGRGPSGTVEGSGREISEPPQPQDTRPVGEAEEPPGESQGQRRKKRKRRT
jgi:hypothetical protein